MWPSSGWSVLSPRGAHRPAKGCAVMGRSAGARGGLLSVRQPNCRELSRPIASFGLGGHLARHPIQSHQTLARPRAGDASDTNPTPARQPTTIQTKGGRHGGACHRRGRRGGDERVLVVANPRDHAAEPTHHHHHKYLPNCSRQSRQKPGTHRTAARPRQSRQKRGTGHGRSTRRPTRPRPRASPTRRHFHRTPR